MGPSDLDPDAQRALLWSAFVGFVGLVVLGLKRRIIRALDANERIPPRRWFARVSKALSRLSRRILKLEHAVNRLDERQTEQINKLRDDHARLHTVEDKVGRIEVKLEMDGD